MQAHRGFESHPSATDPTRAERLFGVKRQINGGSTDEREQILQAQVCRRRGGVLTLAGGGLGLAYFNPALGPIAGSVAPQLYVEFDVRGANPGAMGVMSWSMPLPLGCT